MSGDGFYFDDAALERTQERLGQAAQGLDRVTRVEPPEVDAGKNSQLVAEALADSHRLAVALAQHMVDVGENVDAARGSYHEVENNQRGKMLFDEEYSDYESTPGPAGSGL